MIKEHALDTIAAIATPLGEGGIGIVRLSGPDTLWVADKIFRSKSGKKVSDQPHFTLRHGRIVSRKPDGTLETVDEALISVMRAPKSYTGEDVVEISVHGGSAVLSRVLDECLKAGARPAAPGEFTKRAYLNGRMDLLQAEAVLDVIQAKTAQSLQWATSQLEGALSKKIKSFKSRLLEILAHAEASIDFPDDEIDPKSANEMSERLSAMAGELQCLLDGSALGFLAKRGLRVLIWGRPNVGKSSLLNRLAKSNRAIVTPYPGTTRDAIEEEIQIKGFPIRLIDSAGIQNTDHPIEKEGIDRSKLLLGTADLVLFVLDATKGFTSQDEELWALIGKNHKFILLNKIDLIPSLPKGSIPDLGQWKARVGNSQIISTSCLSENGVDELEDKIFKYISGGRAEIADNSIVSSVRQKELLKKVLECVEGARIAISEGKSGELIAVDTRLALDHLGALVGETTTDDVLDVIFSQFCIGK